MVGLVQEDEYTINVKLRRPLGDGGGCLQPPTITITPDIPAITLTPPPNASFRAVRAAKSEGGGNPLVLATQTRPRQRTLQRPQQQLCIMPPSNLEHGVDGRPRRHYTLPLVQVYDADDTLLGTTNYLTPSPATTRHPTSCALAHLASPACPDPSSPTYCLPAHPASPTSRSAVPALTAPGTLYVPRIPDHCKSDSGVLYVPPVEEEQLRQRQQDKPPTPGNSRRANNQLARRQSGGTSSSSSRAAARALLSHVLTPRLALPPSQHPSEHCLSPDARLLLQQQPVDPLAPRLTLNNLYLAPSHITASHCPSTCDPSAHLPAITAPPRNTHQLEPRALSPRHAYCQRYVDSDQTSGERVVETYGVGGGGGVSATTSPIPTTTTNNGSGGHVGGAPSPPPQPIDPSLLTSLDLEADLHPNTPTPTRGEMLVTDPPSQQPSYPHDFNHNDHHVYPHKPPDDHVGQVSGRAAKYVVRRESDHHHHHRAHNRGHHNFAFEGDLLAGPGQDNFGYDPGYSSERSPEEEELGPLDEFGHPSLYYHHQAGSYGGDADVGDTSSSDDDDDDEEEVVGWRKESRLVPGQILDTHELSKLFTFINEDTVFKVTVTKTLRGLGLAVCGGAECRDLPHPGLVRVKRLYPQTPAWLCGRLKLGDILLSANDQPLTGLTSHEALEMLRIADREVTLEVCRPPPGTLGEGGGEDGGDLTGDGTGSVVSTSLTVPTRSHNFLSPSPSFSSCGEFEVVLTKVAGSLGFTLRKQDNSILGHTIRALVKEPALSDGRLRAGDKIISVNNTNMCSLTHQEAISYLRTCPDTVTLKLYRDAMQTPVSPASPTEPDPTAKPKALRKEARDMLTDLALRKQSPASSLHLSDSSASHHLGSNSASASPATPRRRRLHKTPSPDIKTVVADRWDTLVRESDPTAVTTTDPLTSISESDFETARDSSPPPHRESRHTSGASSSSASTPDTSRPKRPSFLDLTAGRGCPRKSQFTPPHEMDRSFPPSPQPSLSLHHPSSLPPLDQNASSTSPQHNDPTSAHSDAPPFSHLHPTYHSVNLGPSHNFHHHHNHLIDEALTLTNTTSDQNLAVIGEEGSHGLRKWKGVVFTPDEESESSTEEEREVENEREGNDDVVDSRGGGEELWKNSSNRGSPESQKRELVIVELNRGWNSRLGFSLGPSEDGSGQTTITAIYADSVAARDGRLRVGDIVVNVNDVEVAGWDSESVIDLLRKTRGRISLGVLQ